MIKLGEIVPLNLQLFDGNEEMTVRAIVQDSLNKVVFEGQLLHTVGGMYRSSQLLMPDTDILIATYIVFDGKKESKEYERATDKFERDRSDELLDSIQNNSKALFDEYTPTYDDYYIASIVDEQTDEFIEGVINGTFEAQSA